MKKLEFINELGAQLHSMPTEEVRPLLDYYMEIVADRMEDGMTEEEAIDSLGPIPELAEKILAEQPQPEPRPEPIPTPAPIPEPVPQKKHRWSGSSIALAIILSPLWLALLCVLISVEIAVWVTLASLVVSSGAMILGGIACAILSLIPTFDPVSAAARIFVSGCCLVCAGVGCLLLPLSVWLIRLFARFHSFCFKRIAGKE